MHATAPRLHAGRQACLRREAAHAHGLGSAPADPGGREVQSRHADGQSGLLARRHARRLRDPLVRRDRRSEGSPRLDRPPGLAAGDDEDSAAHPVPRTLDWDLWLGGAAARPFTAGDDELQQFVAGPQRAQRTRRGGRGFGQGRTTVRLLPALQLARLLRFRQQPDRRLGRPHPRSRQLGACNSTRSTSSASSASRRTRCRPSPSPTSSPSSTNSRRAPSMPPVTVYWYHHAGGDAYIPPGMTAERRAQDPRQGPASRTQQGQADSARDAEARRPRRLAGSGTPRQPSRGRTRRSRRRTRWRSAAATTASSSARKAISAPTAAAKASACSPAPAGPSTSCPSRTSTRSPGASTGSNHAAHCRDWVRACKGGAPACSNFSIAGQYTEWLVLGAAAVHYEGKLLWDNAKGEFTNNREANKWVKPTFRKGWEIKV